MAKGVRSFEELDCWRLSAELRDGILNISERWKSRDLRFYDQIRDAACSAPRNLAEGFGFYKPRVFAKHARIAMASLHEVQNHLDDALRRRWLTQREAKPLMTLARRAIGATTNLTRYLDSCKGKPPTDWDQNRPRTERNGEQKSQDPNVNPNREPEP